MSDCCNPTTLAITKQLCPECGFACNSVSMTTLYHQVRFPENQQIQTNNNYNYCSTKTCSVGYFSSTCNTIPKSHLINSRAIQNDVLCYCFDISSLQYVSALKAHCAEPIKNFVIQRTKNKECACEIRNPSGQCCLANFKRLQNEYI